MATIRDLWRNQAPLWHSGPDPDDLASVINSITSSQTVSSDDSKVEYTATMAISYDEMIGLDSEHRLAMFRNRVRTSGFSDKAHAWCEENCSDVWCWDDNTLSFMSKDDMTLFLVACSAL